MYILIRPLKKFIKIFLYTNIFRKYFINAHVKGLINIHKKLKLSSIKDINYYLSLIVFYSYVNFLINSPYGLFLNYTAKNDS